MECILIEIGRLCNPRRKKINSKKNKLGNTDISLPIFFIYFFAYLRLQLWDLGLQTSIDGCSRLNPKPSIKSARRVLGTTHYICSARSLSNSFSVFSISLSYFTQISLTTVFRDTEGSHEDCSRRRWEDLRSRVSASLKKKITRILWFSSYSR